MERLFYNLSAPSVRQLPEDEGTEVAFIGRSNVGKSSLINKLGRSKKLARTSKTPGCTLLLNAYDTKKGWRLVDLPGYGFAKRSQQVTDLLGKRIQGYFSRRESLALTVVIMDIRHAMGPKDIGCLAWLYEQERPVHIVLNKADKLSRGEAKKVELMTLKQLKGLGMSEFSVQICSASNGEGCEELWSMLEGIAEDKAEGGA